MTQKNIENNTLGEHKLTSREKTVRLAKMGMLVAISIVLVYFIHFPIFPAVPFLEYDPADISILIGTFAFGPLAGILLTVVTSVIQGVTVSAASGLYGIIMHVISTSVLVLVAGLIYKYNKTRKGAVIALLCGVAAMTLVMIGANMIITPLFMGVPRNIVWDLMPFIAGFNAIKAGINSVVTFLLYKRISGFLHRTA
ncbi:Riboflavin ECF transporter S component RibU [uncultured Eubacterium sp.]|uniref:ECF transporter S component n=1 Tax=Brotomerdimonas butyrica TaxID=2981721 RepID=UPI000822D3D9|nr:ECF transporter S component [Brotomerdimonas butyrica]MCU6756662.1 ECF transporter S component [Brotomerdimonas butyrica]SCH95679.1 Riboflavin ECF transporter S component RibU [uncultured Eubacterium sp.]